MAQPPLATSKWRDWNQGVDDARLDAVGFGEKRPIASNETQEGRARNRRVQFILVERSGGEGEDGDDEE